MLKQLHLKNWRSLRDVTIDFTPITVFIGANSSGKTNIIDALKFRRDSTKNGGYEAISKGEVMTDILPHGINDTNIQYLCQTSKTGFGLIHQLSGREENNSILRGIFVN